MFLKIENLKVHYKVAGQGKPLVLLHGWGCSAQHLASLQKHLAQRFTTYAIDLPGFGLSSPPAALWGSMEYAKLLAQFIKINKLVEPVLVGHSFGGKIILNLVAHSLVKTKKIVLISSAGVRLKRSVRLKLKVYFFKFVKFLMRLPLLKNLWGVQLELYKNKFGSADYRSASGQLRTILVKITNEDLTALLAQIKVPTLLLWGDKDISTPLRAGQIMQQKILGSQLLVFAGSGHFPMHDNYSAVVKALDEFLE